MKAGSVYIIEWSDGVDFIIPKKSVEPGVYETRVQIEGCMDDLLEELIKIYETEWCIEEV